MSTSVHVDASPGPRPAASPGWQLLTTKNFGFLFWGQLTSQIGDSLTRVALLWFVYQLTGSAMKMVMIGLLQTIPPLLLCPFIGVYLDRANKKSVMVWVDLVRTFLVLLIPILHAFGALSLDRLYAAVFLLAVVSTFFGPALSSAVPQIVRRDQLTAANALLQTTSNIGLLVGPIVSGVGIALIGAQNVLYLDAGTFFISALCLLPVTLRALDTTSVPGAAPGRWSDDLWAGLRFVWYEHPMVLNLMLAATLYSLAASAFAFMLPVFAEQNLSAGAMEVGVLWSALGAGMLAASAWLASRRQGDLVGRFNLIFRAMIVGGLTMCGLSVLTGPLVAGAFIMIIGGSTALFMPIMWGVLQEVTPEPLLGRVFATFSTGSMASAMAGMAAFGWAADTLGAHISLLGIGLVLLSTACVAAFSSRRVGAPSARVATQSSSERVASVEAPAPPHLVG
ncbi:MAG: MFS transporter [Nitrospiraceae bacterium]|nr:MFS transporter [Nitrospiraceae bacterium]